jgi:hypothetical protein
MAQDFVPESLSAEANSSPQPGGATDDRSIQALSGPSRRAFVRSGVAGLGSTSLVLGTALGAAAHGTLDRHEELHGDPTNYEPNGAKSSFAYRPSFYDRLEVWEEFYYRNTPKTWIRPLRIDTYGTHVDRGSAAHDNGRGFDLAQIYVTRDGVLSLASNQRYDLWRDDADVTATRRQYWATAASLHHHFRHVLTYLYNTAHWSHIHIDNLMSGTGDSTLDTGSTAQVQYIQAACRYIWGYPMTIDGVWGPQTKSYAGKAIARAGGSGAITASRANWLLFNRMTTRFGSGRQNF